MNSQIEYASINMPTAVYVDHIQMMLGEEIPLSNGDILVVEKVAYPPHPNVAASLMDNESGMCAILIETISDDGLEECIEMVRRYKMLGVEAELANIIVCTNKDHYNVIVLPSPYGCSLFSICDSALAMRAVEKIVECGLDPMGVYKNETIATCNLIHNLTFAANYCREEDSITFATPGEMSLVAPERRQEVLCYARYLISKLF